MAAIVGGAGAIVLTIPIAAAYFRAYEGFDARPVWLPFMERALAPLLEFAPPVTVYEIYGRIYAVVFILYLPAAIHLHRQRSERSRLEAVGFVVVAGALVTTAIGVAADYWANGIGYIPSLFGLLGLAIGSTVWGLGVRRGGTVPTWWALLLIAVGPLSVLCLFLLGHVPSGPALPFAVAWFLLGWLSVTGRPTVRMSAPLTDTTLA
ncbi:hypothetical protein [Mycetocola miduiensis]|uniref:Uncharacterized protein n=1 Tax=Mycetocola miduiensis TaxID=995034 RepID=A0A1I4ZHP2_9MICO|nr:hypothetical protein [Mycetocola miduiensis]SFN49781.1 hypothetical protein SAMN05216219_0824 [Mycetocola miduiensis]